MLNKKIMIPKNLIPYESFSESENKGYVIHRKSGKEVFIGKHDETSEIMHDCGDFIVPVDRFCGVLIFKRFRLDDHSNLSFMTLESLPLVESVERLKRTEIILFTHCGVLEGRFDPEIDRRVYEGFKKSIVERYRNNKEVIFKSIIKNLQSCLDRYNEFSSIIDIEESDEINLDVNLIESLDAPLKTFHENYSKMIDCFNKK